MLGGDCAENVAQGGVMPAALAAAADSTGQIRRARPDGDDIGSAAVLHVIDHERALIEQSAFAPADGHLQRDAASR